MIGFFRRIRKKLANENQFFKYSRYAIGEIVLVMVGILLALQVNNWNNERVERLLEIKVLKEISNNLKIDLREIQYDIMLMDSVSVSCSDMVTYLSTQNEPSEEFYNDAAYLKVTPHFDPNKSGYGLLISKGVEIISNDSLRTSISDLYELGYPYYRKYEQERIDFKIHQTNPLLLKHFIWTTRPDLYVSASFQISNKDYQTVKNDGSLLKLVQAVAYENDLIQDRAKRTEQKIMELMKFVNNELERKGNSNQ